MLESNYAAVGFIDFLFYFLSRTSLQFTQTRTPFMKCMLYNIVISYAKHLSTEAERKKKVQILCLLILSVFFTPLELYTQIHAAVYHRDTNISN